jgi:hypothetical protein
MKYSAVMMSFKYCKTLEECEQEKNANCAMDSCLILYLSRAQGIACSLVDNAYLLIDSNSKGTP